MALPKNFPKDPYLILDPKIRWFPADEDLREQGYEKLFPPFVPELRKEIKQWRKTTKGCEDVKYKYFSPQVLSYSYYTVLFLR